MDLERFDILSSRSGHHGEVVLVVSEDTSCPQADPIPHKNLHESIPVKCVIDLPQVKRNCV